MAISEKQREASRRNGAKSRGPKTPEGKRKSSRNAVKHGLLSDVVVLDNESPEAFQGLQDVFYLRFQPQDDVEEGLVDEMITAHWRLRRLWTVETSLLNRQLDQVFDTYDADRIASAFAALGRSEGANVDLLSRYETRLHRMFPRALDSLHKLRRERAAQPTTPDLEPVAEPLPAPRPPAPITPFPKRKPAVPNEPEARETAPPHQPTPPPQRPSR